MRENLFRSAATFELRAAAEGEMPTMVVNFARFNEWTEIRSMVEGHFMERFAPGAFEKTFREQRDQIRSLFQHGQDPTIGKKVLGPITDLRSESDGGWAEVQLLDTDYVRELVPGLRSGLYGASFQFKPMREDTVKRPARSDDNPEGIPEVTVTEAMLREIGPVTFGQYAGASSGIRSLTDDILLEQVAREQPDRLRDLLNTSSERAPGEEPTPEEEEAPPAEGTPLLAIARRRHALQGRRYVGAPGAAHPPQQ